jgi:putative ABC transport system permease protein
MDGLMRLWRRLLFYLRRNQFDRELEEEIRFHQAMRAEENRAEGMSAEEARYAARRQFGNQTLLREVSLEMWGVRSIETLIQDLRYGARTLLKNPVFTLVAVVTLALGIGMNTAIFSVVYSVLLRPLPYSAPEKLMAVYSMRPQMNSFRNVVSAPDFVDWRAQNKVFDAMSAYTGSSYTLTGSDQPERFNGLSVSANFFQTLGVKPLLGRAFLPEEEEAGRNRVAVLSHDLWQRRFGADPNLVGKTVSLNGESYVVVGVTPDDFRFAPVEIYTPLTFTAEQMSDMARGMHSFLVIARLKAGVTLAQAKTDIEDISRRIERQYPITNAGKFGNVIPYQKDIVGDIRPSLLVLLGAVGLVLLIACANVANLLLARAASRQREIAVRTALGAGRWRIVRQLLSESVVLSLVGGGLGLLLAYWGADILIRAVPSDIADFTPGWRQIGVNPQVLSFSLLISLLTGVVFGLAPALQVSKPDLTDALKDSGKGSAGLKRQRARKVLVIAEMALALVLLIGAGLLIKSFQQLQQVTLGFNPNQVFIANVSLGGAKYRETPRQVNFYQQVLQRVEKSPGLVSAAIVNLPPFSINSDRVFTIAGKPEPAPDAIPDANYRVISQQYFRTLEIPLVRGRVFTDQDVANAPRVVIINEALARRYFPNEDPIGKQIKLGRYMEDNPLHAIVGIVGNIKHRGLDSEFDPEFYYPYAQTPAFNSAIVARTQGDPLSLTTAVRNAVLEVDKEQPLSRARTMEMAISDSVTQRRLNMILLGIFGALALALAAVGIYGVMSYTVTQRTREIGIRMALGARRRDVLKSVVGQGMSLAASGVGIGLVGAFLVTRLMETLLFGVKPTDPATFGGIALLLLGVAFFACCIPARRATKVDPVVALRFE